MKVIFLGTPQFAVEPLKKLINSHHQVLCVVTQPDTVAGRGNKTQIPPVKQLAVENNIPVFQFEKINKEGVEVLKQFNADVMVTCAYGQILKTEILHLTQNGIINIHSSLLPKYRGASPVQCALMHGETQTGVTILRSEEGIDNGDILLQQTCNIDKTDTTETLLTKLSFIGADCIITALDLIESNKAFFTKQDETQASYYKMFKKEDGKINFDLSSMQIANFVRGIYPWPGAYFEYNSQQIKVFSVGDVDIQKLNQLNPSWQNKQNGTVLVSSSKHGLIIKCEKGAVEITEIQAPSSKRMNAKTYLNGKQILIDTKLN